MSIRPIRPSRPSHYGHKSHLAPVATPAVDTQGPSTTTIPSDTTVDVVRDLIVPLQPTVLKRRGAAIEPTPPEPEKIA